METPAPRILSIEERRSILDGSINWYAALGYRVINKTDTSAQVMRPKQFSCAIASLTFFCFGIGVLFYIFAYMAMKDSVVYIAVDDRGVATYNGQVPARPRQGTPPGRSIFTEIGDTLRGSTAGQRLAVAWDEGGTAERAALTFGFGAICFTACLVFALPVLMLMQ